MQKVPILYNGPPRHLDRFSRFAGLTIVADRRTDRSTDRETDHATTSLTIGRICIRSTVMRSKSAEYISQRPGESRETRSEATVWLLPEECETWKSWTPSSEYLTRMVGPSKLKSAGKRAEYGSIDTMCGKKLQTPCNKNKSYSCLGLLADILDYSTI